MEFGSILSEFRHIIFVDIGPLTTSGQEHATSESQLYQLCMHINPDVKAFGAPG